MSKKLQINTLSEQIVEKIKFDILLGELKEGERILEHRLAEDFGVSRIPVREALKALASENYITILPFKGAIVKAVELPEIEEILNIHIALLDLIYEKVKNNYTKEDFDKAEKMLALNEKTTDFRSFMSYTWYFAAAMYAPSKLHHAIEIIKEIYQLIARATGLLQKFLDQGNYSHASNRDFLNLCKEGRYEEAFQSRKNHLIEVRNNLMIALKKLHSEKKAAIA
ncbi:GntR family transcriptional regulator [Solitalea koreensis]|uniref:Transcriptional regulator, GntR family n=1 Tax=Solitalea koreensis TaxID=543615 RepID=A0A521CY50_9SPHI|nr:GntR family transcriptional regulator [Solitalea koreensis]SMO64344.1 transcriptional regulator, GntR family [Solitalea koreensis]